MFWKQKTHCSYKCIRKQRNAARVQQKFLEQFTRLYHYSWSQNYEDIELTCKTCQDLYIASVHYTNKERKMFQMISPASWKEYSGIRLRFATSSRVSETVSQNITTCSAKRMRRPTSKLEIHENFYLLIVHFNHQNPWFCFFIWAFTWTSCVERFCPAE